MHWTANVTKSKRHTQTTPIPVLGRPVLHRIELYDTVTDPSGTKFTKVSDVGNLHYSFRCFSLCMIPLRPPRRKTGKPSTQHLTFGRMHVCYGSEKATSCTSFMGTITSSTANNWELPNTPICRRTRLSSLSQLRHPCTHRDQQMLRIDQGFSRTHSAFFFDNIFLKTILEKKSK